ncbi:tRNA-specific adenosine deaminase [Actinokineospora globicatena]|uniref:tRNA-specific adenosine deaminase n=1 Tax=Actinokineospora globicatena TaxID=103729 RepID=A0A9W6QKE5_9PSEU|nr:tRNA-specific adenosine deaminase [Actinokineospora globicatena]GLW91182.1 tRNA-specific adenosine deaminase [Actinokineospora globicatena]
MLDDAQITEYLREAVALSQEEVDRGGIPFAGLLARPGAGVLGTGVNRVLQRRDPTAHAEIVALRDAAANHDGAAIAESVLFASGEPCGMCYQAAIDAGITSVVYAVGADDAARYGFDYRASYRHVDRTDGGRVTCRSWPVDQALTPFTTWADRNL